MLRAIMDACRRSLIVIGVLVVVSRIHGFAAPPAYAGGFAIPDLGMRKNGMGAVIGRPDDLSAVYHNPAGLVLSQGSNFYLSLGLAFLSTDFRLKPWEGSERFITEPVDAQGYYPNTKPTSAFGAVPVIAVSTNLWSEKLVGAISMSIPNAIGGAFEENSLARYHLIDSYIVAGYGTLSLAYQPIPQFAIGVGFSILYVRVHARRKFFPVIDGVDLSGLFGGNSELELSGDGLVPGWNLGILIRPVPSLSIGFSMISRTDVSLQGDVKLKLGSDAASDGEIAGVQRTELVIPMTFGFGVNWDITKWLEIGAEFRYYLYSEYQNQLTKVSGLDIISELNSPKAYGDSWQISGGIRATMACVSPDLELMAGFHFDKTPAPDHTVSLDQPAFDNTGVHLGVRYRFLDRYHLAATYVHYWYLQRNVQNSVTLPPSNFIGSGKNNMVTLIFGVRFGKGLGMASAL
jgi:long-chain fatty acid transport protein